MTAFLTAFLRAILEWIERKLEKGHVAQEPDKDRRLLRRAGDRIGEWLRSNRPSA